MTIIAATGHRPERLGGYGANVYERMFALAIKHLAAHNPSVVISGMALGWDFAIAEAALVLDMPLHAYIPFVGQESKWNAESRLQYRNMLNRATKIIECASPGYSPDKMHIRDRRMVDDCDKVLALFDGRRFGGTAHTVQYAEKKGRELVNLWEFWNA